jgi:hypothetical protein
MSRLGANTAELRLAKRAIMDHGCGPFRVAASDQRRGRVDPWVVWRILEVSRGRKSPQRSGLDRSAGLTPSMTPPPRGSDRQVRREPRLPLHLWQGVVLR